jgi:hypothetical protein
MILRGLGAAAGLWLVACAPAAKSSSSGRERIEEQVAARAEPGRGPIDEQVPASRDSIRADTPQDSVEPAEPGRRPQDETAAAILLEGGHAVHGTIDPVTGRRTARPAVEQRLEEPRRTEIQAGRLRQPGGVGEPRPEELPQGYRVQVLASPDFAVATREATRLNELLGGRLPVYVEFIDPYYKVRVGDFATIERAQPLLAEIRALGYSDAWSVRTTIKQGGS